MPLPRFVQRLFQNDGYGPKLRNEIIPWDDEKRFTALEAWRQAMIGAPMPMAGTTLPPGFMWADGSFASFAVYPELKAKYDAGGFDGMLLAYNASEADIAAYPGKFKPDAANPAGLFVPRLNGLFARYCGRQGQAGRYNAPGLPNIQGSCAIGMPDGQVATFAYTGAVSTIGTIVGLYGGGSKNRDSTGGVHIDASRVSAVYGASATVMPASVEAPIALYLGKATQI